MTVGDTNLAVRIYVIISQEQLYIYSILISGKIRQCKKWPLLETVMGP